MVWKIYSALVYRMSNVPQDEEDVEGSAEAVNSVECDPTAVPNPQRMMMGGNPGLAGMDINPVGAGRVRSNSDPMSRFDASRLSINQRKVIDSSLSKLFECMTLAYRWEWFGIQNGRSIDWLSEWLFGRSIDWLIDWLPFFLGTEPNWLLRNGTISRD